jgi:hypothetical protein
MAPVAASSRVREVLFASGLVLVMVSLLLLPLRMTLSARQLAGRVWPDWWALYRHADVNVSLGLGCFGLGVLLLASAWVVSRLER